MPIYNYKKEYDISNDKYPVNTHLAIETSVGIYFVDNADRTKVYSLDVSDGTSVQVDIDPDNDSGDVNSRLQDIIAAWHDRSNELIYFVECDNPGSSFEVFYIDYSGGLGSESTTDIGDKTLATCNVIDIFMISTDIFVSLQQDNYSKIYKVTSSPFVLKSLLLLRLYGFYGGGGSSVTNYDIIDYIDVTTLTGNASDTGNLLFARYALGACFGSSYCFFCGGTETVGAPSVLDNIEYIDINTVTQNSVDRGNLVRAKLGVDGLYGEVYGFIGGGVSGVNVYDDIDYIDLSLTVGNASDKGNLTVARYWCGAVPGVLYGYYGGGRNLNAAARFDTIDYIDVTTTSGNATDRGNLTVARDGAAGLKGTYGFFCGGNIPDGGASGDPVDVIDYIDLTSTSGNASDKGNLTKAKRHAGSTGSSYYGFIGGGEEDGPDLDDIEYIDMTTTTGNGIDRGNLTQARPQLAGG